MSQVNAVNIFPPEGRVLVVGLAPDAEIASKFGARVMFWEASRIKSVSDIPKDVAAISRHKNIDPAVEERVTRCIRIRQIRMASLEVSTESLSERLDHWLQGLSPVEEKPKITITISGLEVEVEGMVVLLQRDRIAPNPGQPRVHHDPEDLASLARSIEERGQEMPIVVFRIFNDPRHDFMIVEGERRWRACGMIGKSSMRAIIAEVTDEEDLFEKALVANLNRVGHTPIEMARAMVRIRDGQKYAHLSPAERLTRICAITGWKQLWAQQYMEILTLPDEVQNMMAPTVPAESRLKVSIAVFLCTIGREMASEERSDLQSKIALEVVRRNLNTNQARDYARVLTHELGVEIGKRRSAGDDRRSFLRFLRNLSHETRMLSGPQQEKLKYMFRLREPTERGVMIDEFDRSIERLQLLSKAMKRWNK